MKRIYKIEAEFDGEALTHRYQVIAGGIARAVALGERLARRDYRQQLRPRGRVPRIIQIREVGTVDGQ